MSKRKNACEFSPKERKAIIDRDKSCIFCQMGYRLDNECGYGLQIMHYIARSQGGLGIQQNGALGCLKHHQLLDNFGDRDEMKELFRDYLKSHYPDWKEEDLIFRKWS